MVLELLLVGKVGLPKKFPFMLSPHKKYMMLFDFYVDNLIV